MNGNALRFLARSYLQKTPCVAIGGKGEDAEYFAVDWYTHTYAIYYAKDGKVIKVYEGYPLPIGIVAEFMGDDPYFAENVEDIWGFFRNAGFKEIVETDGRITGKLR